MSTRATHDCLHCDDRLYFGSTGGDPTHAWRHASDGEIIRQRPAGRDDHVATPDRSQDPF